jgi:putative nucleotidyltransferase with HDIG domain
LQQANRDLLKALVKAIETRDPYTSGHSLRVSHLARRIAEQMHLAPAAVDEVETAALLHDVGKIDAVYTGILAKPDALSPDERQVIQSHVTKGEELLRNLASVPEAVILAVRHHHEREDGGGYPDGLAGRQIPIGSQIIGVCDAVDAMLSDRPYRKALGVPTVLEQLREHSGTQFNPQLVAALLESDLLREYAAIVRASHGHPGEVMDRLSPDPVLRSRQHQLIALS